MTESFDQKINALIEKEREILKKISIAKRAMASQQLLAQLQFLLEECRMQQAELRMLKSADTKNSSFDDFLSIG